MKQRQPPDYMRFERNPDWERAVAREYHPCPIYTPEHVLPSAPPTLGERMADICSASGWGIFLLILAQSLWGWFHGG